MTQAADYKSTLNLPKTEFAMKADLTRREPEMLKQWDSLRLFEMIQQARQSKPKFILHDGPPYANGDIHIGHALNKILKDFIVRYKTLRGYASPYVPGWDCHGMPIEHQLFKELKLTKHQIDQASFRAKARAYAEQYVNIQREQFKRLGVTGDWDHPYLTMARDYELTILRVFKELVGAGAIYRGRKPVYWCATCETALAEAEVEYEDRTDASIYVKFPLQRAPAGVVYPAGIWDGASVVAWTTTPWTLPANVALCFYPGETYVLVSARDRHNQEQRLVVAQSRLNELRQMLGLTDPSMLQSIDGKTLGKALIAGEWALKCVHPFGRTDTVGVTDEGVDLGEGTGVIHIAPGHGQEDYAIGQRYQLPTLSPVDHQGRFTKDVPQFAGQTVFEANPKIIADLKQRGLLLHEEAIIHSYPHCWRCKQPVIFRATPQWFLRVDEKLRKQLLDSISKVRWIPEAGQNRMRGMLENRPDWCLSRQRYWGTPIPVLHCAACEEPLLDVKVIGDIEKTLTEKGTDYWFSAKPEELAPGAACPKCRGSSLRKETDILDVWFDSGVSYEAVLKQRPELAWPAGMYLEGSDQHRGWFQVSLIPSVALHGRPPYEQVLTHGFVMDGEGRKMSKSLGNVVAPQDVMQKYGADILRLWVASSDYGEDVRISGPILENVAEAYRKIRNTFRYLLSNLYDFRVQDRQPEQAMGDLDRWALHRTQRLLHDVTDAYEGYQFHQAFRAVYQFCVVDLSAFYLDALKDRLYTDAAGSPGRRCAQTVLYAILQSLVKLIAPMMAITADEVWQEMRRMGLVDEPSVHVTTWPEPLVRKPDEALERRWETFLAVRGVVMKKLEEQRAAKVIGSPLEAEVTLVARDPELNSLLEKFQDVLPEAFVVSAVRVTGAPGGESGDTVVSGLVQVIVERAPGAKCQRCWRYQTTVGTHAAHPQLCGRCAAIVSGI